MSLCETLNSVVAHFLSVPRIFYSAWHIQGQAITVIGRKTGRKKHVHLRGRLTPAIFWFKLVHTKGIGHLGVRLQDREDRKLALGNHA